MIARFPLIAALLFTPVLPVLAGEALLRYSFTRGTTAPLVTDGALHANAFSVGEGGLFGVSPATEQCFILMKSALDQLPATRKEALESAHAASFSITPAEGRAVTLRELSFAMGAASVRLSGEAHAFLKVEVGADDLEIPITFTRVDEESTESFPIRAGDRREVMIGRGVADLSQLPAPLAGPVTFRLYIDFTGGDLATIPAGTNYSIRLDDFTLTGKVR